MNFKITETSRENIDEFNLIEILYNITFSDLDQTFGEANDNIVEMFDNFLLEILKFTRPNDMINLNIFHQSFSMPVCIPFTKAKEFKVDLIIGSLENVIQSYKETIVNLNNSFNAKCQIVRLPYGSGRRKLTNAPKKSYYKKK